MDGRTVRLSVITDITQRKMVEKELNGAKERAEEATRLKDKFLSLVAHDLRSPFVWIMGFLKKMINDQAHPLHETHRGLVRRILDGGESMVNMIDSLLKISRLQSGKIALALQFMEMNMPIRSVLHNFLPLAEKKGVVLAAIEKATPHLIITDLFMPVMDGFELMRRVHRNPRTKSIPIIVITSDAEMETREKAVRLGADDFILKTAGVEEFLPRVLKFVA